MAVKNGTFIQLTIAGTKLVGEVSTSKDTQVDEINISSKASGRTSRILPGRVKETISFESLCDEDSADYGYSSAHAAAKAGTLVAYKIALYDATGTQVDGSEQDVGSGYIMSLTKDNPDNDRSTMSGSISIDDESTVSTYSA